VSLFNNATLDCGSCGHAMDVSWAASVNADRRPDLRDNILAGTFQATQCELCDQPVRFPPHLTYVDVGRQEWILVEDPSELDRWPDHEKHAQAVFDENFGPRAPEVVRDLAAGLRIRLVFGWPALREKLVLTELGLDDEVVELTKLAVINGAIAAPIGGSESMRIVGEEDGQLQVAVTHDITEAVSATTTIPRDLYNDIAADIGSWKALRDQWAGQPFIDTSRLFVGA